MNNHPTRPAGAPHPSCPARENEKGFTLFETIVALGVFVLAALGLAQAIQGAIDVAILARDRALTRTLLESRLAYNLVDPPRPGAPRKVEIDGPPALRFEETLIPHTTATNAKGRNLADLYELTILATPQGAGEPEKISILMHRPRSLHPAQ